MVTLNNHTASNEVDEVEFGNFQPLGCQTGNKISCTVSLCNGESTAGTAEAQQVVCLSASAIYTQYILAN